jgi:hypothetical protein
MHRRQQSLAGSRKPSSTLTVLCSRNLVALHTCHDHHRGRARGRGRCGRAGCHSRRGQRGGRGCCPMGPSQRKGPQRGWCRRWTLCAHGWPDNAVVQTTPQTPMRSVAALGCAQARGRASRGKRARCRTMQKRTPALALLQSELALGDQWGGTGRLPVPLALAVYGNEDRCRPTLARSGPLQLAAALHTTRTLLHLGVPYHTLDGRRQEPQELSGGHRVTRSVPSPHWQGALTPAPAAAPPACHQIIKTN